jgi:hypothetical protein
MFRFNLFPQLIEMHKQYKKLIDELYDLEFQLERSGGKKSKQLKYDEAYMNYNEYANNVYGKVIFDIFSKIAPKLYNKRTQLFVDWNSVFCDEFDMIPENVKPGLSILIEQNGGIYRLSPEYYDKD